MQEIQAPCRTLWVDVTTLAGWRGNPTGIARTLEQILHHWLTDTGLPIRLCRYDAIRRQYLNADALAPALAGGPPAPKLAPSPSTPRTGGGSSEFRGPRIPGDVGEAMWHMSQAARCLGRLGRALTQRTMLAGRRALARSRARLPGVPFQSGDALLVGGASWKDSPPAEVLGALRQGGVRIASIVYDITPLRCPHLCSPDLTRAFSSWLPGVLGSSDLVVTISEHSARDLIEFGRQQGVVLPPLEKIRLGDEAGDEDGETLPGELLSRAPGPFLLYVSTIGLNKNQNLLFQVWRRLIDRHGGGVPTLVLVGQPGWRAEHLLRELRMDSTLSRHVVHLGKTDDRQLRWLYRRCLFTLYPSHYEGWGLPVAEGLALGKYCICSSAASLPEVGGVLADYHDPLDGPGCLRLIEKALLEPGWLASREERVRREYRSTSWALCASQTFSLLDRHFSLIAVANRAAA